MTDDILGFGAIFEKLTEWVQFRKVERLRIFAEEVTPVMQDIRETHQFFLRLHSQFDVLTASLAAAQIARPNDVSQILESAEKTVREMRQQVDDGREKRASLFQRAKAYEELQPKDFSLYTTKAERSEITNFYASVRLYFRWHNEAYRHAMRSPIADAVRAIAIAKSSGEIGEVASKAGQASVEMGDRIKAFEDNWLLISAAFYRVEKQLVKSGVVK